MRTEGRVRPLLTFFVNIFLTPPSLNSNVPHHEGELSTAEVSMSPSIFAVCAVSSYRPNARVSSWPWLQLTTLAIVVLLFSHCPASWAQDPTSAPQGVSKIAPHLINHRSNYSSSLRLTGPLKLADGPCYSCETTLFTRTSRSRRFCAATMEQSFL